MNEGVRNDGSLAVNGRTTRNIASVHDEATISAIAVTGPKAGDLPGGLAQLLVWPPPFEAQSWRARVGGASAKGSGAVDVVMPARVF